MIKRLYSWLYKITAGKDEKDDRFGGFVQGAVRRAALKLCASTSGRALEVGTGSGLFLIQLALQNPGLKIWSIDTNDEYLDLTAKKIEVRGLRDIHLLCQDARATAFDEGFFDVAICINIFLDVNIESVVMVLREMNRVTGPSGRIIFEFRNSRNILFRLKYKLARYYDPSAPYPLYTYDPDRIDDIIKNLNLVIVDKKYLGFPIKRFAPIIIVEARKRC